MQTPPLLPSLNATPSTASPSRQPDGAQGENDFTQTLSRQMNQREVAMAAPKQVEGPKAAAPKSADSSAPSANAEKVADAGDGNATAAAAPADAPPGAAAKTAAGSKEKTDGAAGAKTDTATDVALNASAAVMALVATTGAGAAKVSTAVPAASTAVVDSPRLAPAPRGAGEAVDGKKLPFAAADGESSNAAVGTNSARTGVESATEFSGKNAPQLIAATPHGSVETVVGAALPATLIGAAPDAANVLPQLSATALNLTLPSGPMPGNTLAPSVGARNWDQSLGQRMIWMVAGAEQSASLTLNPPDLGPLQVVLQVTNGQADASFYAAQPEVRQALEAALPRLREMMGQAGVTLGQASVSAGNPQHQDGAAHGASSGVRRIAASGAEHSVAISVGGAIRSGGNGLVDTFA